MTTTLKIIGVLRSHVGRENLISSADLARRVGLRPTHARQVRDLLSEALHDGTLEELEVPLCAIPGSGYFLAADVEEAQAYHDFLHALATEASRKTTAVKKLFRAAFGIHLNTSTK